MEKKEFIKKIEIKREFILNRLEWSSVQDDSEKYKNYARALRDLTYVLEMEKDYFD